MEHIKCGKKQEYKIKRPADLSIVKRLGRFYSENLGCTRCLCKQAFTLSLARAFAPKKAVAGKCVLSELNARLA